MRTLWLALAHALLFVIAFPPFDVWPAALAAIMPLAVVGMRAARPFRAALVVWIVASLMWLFIQRWLIGVTVVGWPLLAMYLALYPAAFVWISARFARRTNSVWRLAFAMAVVWTGLEMLRGSVMLTGYAWFLIAHPLIETPMAQLAEYGGVYGVSLIVAFAQCLVAASLMVRPCGKADAMRASVAVGIVGAAMVGGTLVSAPVTSATYAPRPRARIAVVQTNVPQSNKSGWPIEQRLRDFARMRALTLEAAGAGDGVGGQGAEDGRDARPTGAEEDGRDARPTGAEEDGRDARPTGAGEDGRDATLTEDAPDLIIWPETMFPGESLDPDVVEAMREARLVFGGEVPATAFSDAMMQLQSEVAAPLLVGAIGYDGFAIETAEDGSIRFDQEAKYNSAFLIEGGAVAEARYDKLHLTPFGEVMPLISRSDRLEALLLSLGAPGMAFDLEPGAGRVVFEVEIGEDGRDSGPIDPRHSFRLVTPICFEAATPGVCRRLVFEDGVRQADVMVNLTNDGWFGDSRGGRWQHLQVARWRCIELRTPMVRAANTGVSAVIDTLGRIQAVGPDNRDEDEHVDGVMRATVARPLAGTTLYGRIGEAPGWICLGGAALITLSGFFAPARRAEATPANRS